MTDTEIKQQQELPWKPLSLAATITNLSCLLWVSQNASSVNSNLEPVHKLENTFKDL